ncbi:30S ribosomal protein S16 [bacterium]|nr:30S ribosomal protein S16 [candidate division CSSED10-310 bacterium]
MATKIRLKRIGSKKNAYYRIVVADERTAPTGKILDLLGTYDPHQDPPKISIDMNKVDEWLAKGVQPTPKMSSILKKARKQSVNTTTS